MPNKDPNQTKYACAIQQGIERCLLVECPQLSNAAILYMNIALLGLSLRFPYSHLLFSETLALPVDGVGVPGVILLELSLNRVLLIELP
jgi:hypothetical protein